MKQKILTILTVFLLTILLIAGCSQEEEIPENSSQSGFATPEAALTAYLEGLRNTDIDQMLSAFAIETFVEHAVLFELNGQKHLLLAEAAIYDGEWYLTHFGGNIAALLGIPPLNWGIVFPEFVDAIIAGAAVMPPAE